MLNEVHCFIGFMRDSPKPTTGNVGFAAQITTLKGEKTSLQQQILGVLLGSAFHLEISGKARQNCRFWSCCVMFSINQYSSSNFGTQF